MCAGAGGIAATSSIWGLGQTARDVAQKCPNLTSTKRCTVKRAAMSPHFCNGGAVPSIYSGVINFRSACQVHLAVIHMAHHGPCIRKHVHRTAVCISRYDLKRKSIVISHAHAHMRRKQTHAGQEACDQSAWAHMLHKDKHAAHAEARTPESK